MWEQVQIELARREELGAKYSSHDIFASKLICEDCGGFYGKKIWHSTSKYAREIYQCNKKFSKAGGKHICSTPHYTEDEIKKLFIKGYNMVMVDKDRLLEDTKEVITLLTDTSSLDEKIESVKNEIEIVSELARKLVAQNSKVLQSQSEYQKRHNDLSERYTKLKNELDDLINERAYKLGQSTKLKVFINELENAESVLDRWDEQIWMLMVEKGIVHKDKSITFVFYN